MKSDLTLLIWGRTCWIEGTEAPIRLDHLGNAPEVIAQALAGNRGARLRLIYQPEGFQSLPVSCPKGDRARIASALAHEVLALGDPAYAWGFEPVLGTDEPSTLLHVESEPELFALVHELEGCGFRVATAWPLATFLQFVPREVSETGAFTVVAAQAHRGLAFRHGPDGKRTVEAWHGPAWVDDARAWLQQARKADSAEQLVVVVEDEGLAEKLAEGTEAERRLLRDVVGSEVALPAKHPAQLLPVNRLPFFNALAYAASVALFLAAGALAALQIQAQAKANSVDAERAREIATLQDEIVELERLSQQQALDNPSSATPPPALAPMLRKIGRTIPKEVVLESVSFREGRLEVTGYSKPGTDPSVISTWSGAIAENGVGLHTPASTDPSGRFVLVGDFRG